jgi:hypothetical protein
MRVTPNGSDYGTDKGVEVIRPEGGTGDVGEWAEVGNYHLRRRLDPCQPRNIGARDLSGGPGVHT